jgi:hypothetical protein
MAKKRITVRTVKAKNKVEILPDASAPVAAPVAEAGKPSLALAQPAGAPQGVVMSEHLQNPFDDAKMAATGPDKYTWPAIVMLLSTMIMIGVLGIQYFEWDTYHGGFEPCFKKTLATMPGIAPVVAPVAAPAAPVADDMGLSEEPLEESSDDDSFFSE